jgi:hypothetical protein
MRSDNFFGRTIRLPASAVTWATKGSIYHILPTLNCISAVFLIFNLTNPSFYHISTMGGIYVNQATSSWAQKTETARIERTIRERDLLY